MKNPFRYFNSSPEVIRLTVMMYIRYPLSLRQVEDLLYHFNLDRHLTNRDDFKKNRSAALAE
jgi:transposase-like protein